MTKLSILICTLPKRRDMFDSLVSELYKQSRWKDMEAISNKDENISIGQKRNELLGLSSGEYIAFIDDDDRVSPNYISLLMEGIAKNVDCCSLVGEYTVNGKNPKKFLHYLACEKYDEIDGVYHRYPNHLNCIRASIAKQFKFPEKNWGEDTDWATQIKKSGLLKTEHTINETIYYYDKRT